MARPILRDSTRAAKRYSVVWDGKTIHYGSPTAFTFADGASQAKRDAYLARHGAPGAGEDWSDPSTSGFWARHHLWSVRGIKKGFAEAVRRAELATRQLD